MNTQYISNVEAKLVSMEIQRGATTPKISIELEMSNGELLDWSTVEDVNMWVNNYHGDNAKKLSIGTGLLIASPESGPANTLLVITDVFDINIGDYEYDAWIILDSNNSFPALKGNISVVKRISQ